MTADKVTEYYHLAFHIIDKTQQKSVFYKIKLCCSTFMIQVSDIRPSHLHNPELDKWLRKLMYGWMFTFISTHNYTTAHPSKNALNCTSFTML